MEIQYASFVAILILASAFLIGGWIGEFDATEQFWARRRYISAAAGISVAYIFIDVLPELEAQRKVVIEASGDNELFFAEQRIYMLALLSFVVMYGLQHMVLVSREKRREGVKAGEADALYWLQLFGFAAYSALIGYLLVERGERGAPALATYTFAMAVHFLIVDHSLTEEHGGAYGWRGRSLLAASAIAGWCIASTGPLSAVSVARLFAVLAGGVVITSLRTELPDDRTGRFW